MSSLTLILYGALFIPILLVVWVQARVRRVFNEQDQYENSAHVNGLEAARELLDQAGLHQVQLRIESRLASDYYDPVNKVLVLSPRTARRSTVLAVGVAGHEVGHAVQDSEGYPFIRLRSWLGRWLIALSTISPIAFIGGFFLGSVLLMWVAVAILAFQVVFALITLPVELNASHRAIPMLEGGNLIGREEEPGVRRVLRAAALTYLVSVAIRVAVLMFWFVLLALVTGLKFPF